MINIYLAIQNGHNNNYHPHNNGGIKNLFRKISLFSIIFLLICNPIIDCSNQWNNDVSNGNNSSSSNSNEYSITNFLPSFSTLLFWRQPESSLKINNQKQSVQQQQQQPIVTREIHQQLPAMSAALVDDDRHSSNNDQDLIINTSPSPPSTMIVTNSNRNRYCHSCSNGDYMYQDNDEEYRQRIEFIKVQILNKLGLKEPPKFANQPDIDLINMYMRIVGQTQSTKRNADNYNEQDDDDDEQQKQIENPINRKNIDQNTQIIYILPKHYQYYHLKSPIFDLTSINQQQQQQQSNDNLMFIKSIIILVKYSNFDLNTNTNNITIDQSLLDLTISSVSGLIELKRNAVINSNDNNGNRNGNDEIFDLISIVSPTSRIAKTTTTIEQQQQQQQNEESTTYEYDVTNLLLNNNNNNNNNVVDSGDSDDNNRIRMSLLYDMIRIYNENFDIKSSFIKVEMTNVNNNKAQRVKRSVDCTDKISFCCRQPFYVNFTTIGWNNWILHPLGYNGNYCKGQCDLSHARYHHTTVMGKYPVIKLCCSPREMSSISLIYMDNDYNIYQKNLPNMVVESCDCA
uniref:TGF-beta family profile domain-containing protein n=1 Tax=Dermatophagoides pteronyssinus TaxID=6956 RepID=A0A6P6Y9E9_DERPT|nr:putative uncharacterized protein DDB_G0282499 [Dermatophagoides pteronyssinus]